LLQPLAALGHHVAVGRQVAARLQIAARDLDLARHILVELRDIALQPLDERHQVGCLAPLFVERPFLEAQ
jgi:hypothetical protein